MPERQSATILLALSLHLSQLVAILVDSSALNVTSVYPLVFLLGPQGTVVALFGSSVLVVVSFFMNVRKIRAMLLLPKLILLIISAVGAIDYMRLSHFADGVVRPQAFIVADQVLIVLLTLAYAWSVFAVCRRLK